MCDDNGKSFIATLHNVLLAPDLCDKVFSIITLMNSGHNSLFHKGFSMVNFGAKEKKRSNITTQCTKETCIFGEKKEMSRTKKLPARKKIALELLHQRL